MHNSKLLFDFNSLDDGGSVWIDDIKVTHNNIRTFQLKLIHGSSIADVYQHSEDTPFIVAIKSLKFFRGCAYEGNIKVDWFGLEIDKLKKRTEEI